MTICPTKPHIYPGFLRGEISPRRDIFLTAMHGSGVQAVSQGRGKRAAKLDEFGEAEN